MDFKEELENLIKANIPAIQVVTYEWQRLYGFCVGVADDNNLDLFSWSVVSGLKKWDKDNSQFIEERDEKDPIDLLEWFKEKNTNNCILIVEDFIHLLRLKTLVLYDIYEKYVELMLV